MTHSGRPRCQKTLQRQSSWLDDIMDWKDMASFLQENIETLLSVRQELHPGFEAAVLNGGALVPEGARPPQLF